MALLFGVCFFLYFLKLSAGKGFCHVYIGTFSERFIAIIA